MIPHACAHARLDLDRLMDLAPKPGKPWKCPFCWGEHFPHASMMNQGCDSTSPFDRSDRMVVSHSPFAVEVYLEPDYIEARCPRCHLVSAWGKPIRPRPRADEDVAHASAVTHQDALNRMAGLPAPKSFGGWEI